MNPVPHHPNPFPVTRVSRLPRQTSASRWLVDDFWGDQAVGFIGALPKAGKTWLSIELAVSVASGSPFLGRYAVHGAGPVLMLAAEDPGPALAERAEAVAASKGLDYDRLPLGLITEPLLLLDEPAHTSRLADTVEKYQPRMLVLDPLVRLHRSNENDAGQVSAILAFLRSLNRRFGTAVVLVHHVRKTDAASPGLALRGSVDLYAWADSCLSLLPRGEFRILHAEHRSNPAPRPILLHLVQDPPHLAIVAQEAADDEYPTDIHDRVLNALREHPCSATTLRSRLGVRNETLGRTLAVLEAEGKIRREKHHWAATVPTH
ncbi:MAG: AAA family ATPase [Myxococcota bacterium]|nr:AAA family ATPase [Myxococcota bacterium]